MGKLLLLGAALFACVGTAPGPTASPAATDTKPLRHLEYTFRVDWQGVSEYHYNGIGNGVDTSSGVGGAATSDGGSGTMYVDVLSIAPDGSLVVRISELVLNDARPRQAFACNVYGNTAVSCPSVPAPSQAEWVLLSYLGRQFVDGAPWDAQNHWQRKTDGSGYQLVEDFAIEGADNGKLTMIREKKTISLHNGAFGTETSTIAISYDRALEVPVSVLDDVTSTGQAGSAHTSLEFHLVRDSFSKPAPG